ncbi:Transmembrane protein 230 [Heracleum sosnowskyi]|uniref:Transmembrane protein 230 n=1 Tax=Heracleum sosnowskyi TaxID=360622 RepID=A0AAD8JCB5_9APIA|nr:Transmembrane protein 230 [Heracleum sosnowskyi]
MAYVDQAFSITDDDLMMDDYSFSITNRPPIKQIAFAVSLFVFGILVIVSGVFMSLYKVGGDHAHGVFFAILGLVMFIPGFYNTWVAYHAYKGYKLSSSSNDSPV